MKQTYTHPLMEDITYRIDRVGRYYYKTKPIRFFATSKVVYSGLKKGFVPTVK